MNLTNAISIDVEDYFQVSAFEHRIDRADWDALEHRVERNTAKLRDIFDHFGVKSTFFVLGWVAERYPGIVRRIVDDGHEIASHGYGHQRVTDLTPKIFREDIDRAKKALEDIGGHEVKGYRAPSYSIGRDNIWALDVVAETGHRYSSSIYPVRHDHYGFPEAPRFAFRDAKSGIIEIPITTVRVLNRARPAGGGGFFRFYPYPISKRLIDMVNRQDGRPVVFYLHPWELDPEQPRQTGISAKTRFRHYLNLNKTEKRLIRLISDFKWDRVDRVFLEDLEIPEVELAS